MSNEQEQEYSLDEENIKPTRCTEVPGAFYGSCPVCKISIDSGECCPNIDAETLSFKKSALEELSELNQFMEYPKSLYLKTQIHIEQSAENHNDMSVSAFVDMCLDMAMLSKTSVQK